MSLSFSSSSVHTARSRDVGKLPIKEESFDSFFNLDNLELPDTTSAQSLGFLDYFEEDVSPEPTPLSPRTLDLRSEVIRLAKEEGDKKFADKPSLTYSSMYATRPVNCDLLDSLVDLRNGWRCTIPKPEDPVWFMPEYGMHGIPFLYFEFGLRLPMHSFHLAIYEALGCGIAQVTPNSIA